ncbi:CPBP family intramembrane metalloprotease [Patescibacteria group bacterium]|nr:CPBP family intramembrane metalloprotease [Patescibacteria group bacterium]
MLLAKKKESKSNGGKNYFVSAFWAFIVILLIKWFFPSVIPFGIFEFWTAKAPLWSAIIASWPIFLWVSTVSFIFYFLEPNSPYVNHNPEEEFLIKGFVISAFAGLTEEIVFRWLFFLNAIWSVKLVNWLFFGWFGWGIPQGFYTYLIVPVANFFTLGSFADILYHPLGWFVGAAVIIANAKFRAGHKYLGIFGYINSWFIGMFLFWLMFQYGLLACIVVHFLYDFIIYVIRYIHAVTE